MENSDSPYSLVIADLKKKRAELTKMIENLEAMSGLTVYESPTHEASTAGQGTETFIENGENPYLGMSIGDAAKELLKSKRKPLGNSEILAGIEAGGVVLTGDNKLNTVGAVMNRRQNKQGDIVSVKRGVWGLKEWYPNRSFGKKDNDNKDDDSEAGSIPEDTSHNYSDNVTPLERPNGTEQL